MLAGTVFWSAAADFPAQYWRPTDHWVIAAKRAIDLTVIVKTTIAEKGLF